jgi:hypothetical protein
MYDLYTELRQKQKELDISIKQLRTSGTEKAKTEQDYKVLLCQESLRLRDGGMAVGMIDKVVYGLPSVAELRFKRDTAVAVWTANLEAINSIKLQLRLIESQINREWGASNG